MQENIERLKADHEVIGAAVWQLLPRVARRPVSRTALSDLLEMLDTRLAAHEREEERLFAGVDETNGLLAAVYAAHERIEDGRKALRDGLANWYLPGGHGALAAVDPEALAARAEEVLHLVLEQFEHEERLVAELAGAVPEAPLKAARAKG
jgi:hypothetical protein